MRRALFYMALIPPLLVAFVWLVWSSQITPSDAAPLNADCVYVVKRGDTLSGIAQRYNTTVAALVEANTIANPNLIHVGNRFVIPGCGAGQAQPAPSAPRPAASPTAPSPSSSGTLVEALSRAPTAPATLDVTAEHAAKAATVQILVATPLSLNVGTGTVVGTDGRTVLTAFHLVGDTASGTAYPALEIRVGPYKGYSLHARLVASDPENDLAVLEVEQRPDFTGFAFLPLADSDAVRLGEPIYLLSYPVRPEGGVGISRGHLLAIVSDLKTRQREGFITNASASPGSSGGVAVNAQGEVLGIITRGFFPNQDMNNPDLPPISSLTGLVPINQAQPTLDKAANR